MKNLVERAEGVIPGAVLGGYPFPGNLNVIVDYGNGSRVWSTEGEEYVDYLLGSGPLILGHSHPTVVDAVSRQLSRGTTFNLLSEPAIMLAERICDLVPCAEGVKFVADGSEATFYALRLARAYTGRTRTIRFKGSYHGHHDYAVSANSSPDTDRQSQISVRSAGVPSGASNTVLEAYFNDISGVESLICDIGDVAAVIVEPVQRCLLPQDEFLADLRSICSKYGVLLIFDEVVTGFRLSLGGAQEVYGVKPDLCCLGKALGGGFPIAAVVGSNDIIRLSVPYEDTPVERYVYLSGTLNGNPLCTTAALATLEALETEDSYKTLYDRGHELMSAFCKIGEELSIPINAIGPGPWFELIVHEGTVSQYSDLTETERTFATLLGIELVQAGILLRPGGKWYLSTQHDERDMEATVHAFEHALRTQRSTFEQLNRSNGEVL